MTPKPPVDRLFDERQRLIELLDANKDMSLRVSTDTTLRKVLILSAASYFERYIKESIMDFVSEASERSRCVMSLVEQKAVERQYHTYFQWKKGKNANSFFAMFGPEVKTAMQQRMRSEPELADGVKAFLEIGALRNDMVHSDFGSYSLDMTADEIMSLHRRAWRFVKAVPQLLGECGGGDAVE